MSMIFGSEFYEEKSLPAQTDKLKRDTEKAITKINMKLNLCLAKIERLELLNTKPEKISDFKTYQLEISGLNRYIERCAKLVEELK